MKGPSRGSFARAELLLALCMLAGIAATVTFRALHWVAVAAALTQGVRVARASGRFTPSGGFGWANRVTALRLGFVAWLGIDRGAPGWLVTAVVVGVLLLDGLDGWLARARGEASEFGAAFDMETDAALVATLSARLWLGGAVGAWVLLAGVWRYAFVLLTTLVPLHREAPRSRFARVVFASLVLLLGAAFVSGPGVAVTLAAAGTTLVSISFGRSFYLAWR